MLTTGSFENKPNSNTLAEIHTPPMDVRTCNNALSTTHTYTHTSSSAHTHIARSQSDEARGWALVLRDKGQDEADGASEERPQHEGSVHLKPPLGVEWLHPGSKVDAGEPQQTPGDDHEDTVCSKKVATVIDASRRQGSVSVINPAKHSSGTGDYGSHLVHREG